LKSKIHSHGAVLTKNSICLLLSLLGWMGIANSLFGQGATNVVTSLNDDGPGSLRQQIAASKSGDTISFDVVGTIMLTNGELLVTKNLRIVGPSATNLAISAGRQSRILEITSRAKVRLSGLTICDGRAPDGTAGTSNSPAGRNGMDGGGIYNAGSLIISRCTITNCSAGNGGSGYISYSSNSDATNWFGGNGGRGGALYNAGRLQLLNSMLISNSSGNGGNGGGEGVYDAAGGSGGGGGAIFNVGSMMITSCNLEHNIAGSGAGTYIFVFGTFGGGRAGGQGGDGGAIYDSGQDETLIFDSQFRFNSSGAGASGTPDDDGFLQLSLAGAGGGGGGGGAIWASASLRLNHCNFQSNQTGSGGVGGHGMKVSGEGGIGGPGGAICALGSLILNRSVCSSNQTGAGGAGAGASGSGACGSGGAGGPGGAVFAASVSRLTDCTFTGNSTAAGGHGGDLTHPRSQYFSGRGGRGGSGGAVCCQFDLRAINCTFTSNQAGDAGEAGYAEGDALNSGQPSSSSSDGGEGGAIFGLGPVVLHACTLTENRGGNGGSADPPGPHRNFIWYQRIGRPGGSGGTGGICSENSLAMSLCTLSGNRGGLGGMGGASWGGFMYDVPPAGGDGGQGGVGAISSFSGTNLLLVACTLAANNGGLGGPAGYGGGVGYMHTNAATGGIGGVGGILGTTNATSASLINTLVALNPGGAGGAPGSWIGHPGQTGAPDLQGWYTSLGHNLIGQTDANSGFTNGVNGDIAGSASAPINPLLGPLSDNGGPTPTMALLNGSPALDAGDDALLLRPYALRKDQRGFPRKSGSHVDIGAFEFQFQDSPSIQSPIISGTLSANGTLQSDATAAQSDSSAPGPAPAFQLSFSNHTAGATFTILATTNLALPLNTWTVLGQPIQTAPHLFQFIDTQLTDTPCRFYRVSSP
jgi:hypothetical protein